MKLWKIAAIALSAVLLTSCMGIEEMIQRKKSEAEKLVSDNYTTVNTQHETDSSDVSHDIHDAVEEEQQSENTELPAEEAQEEKHEVKNEDNEDIEDNEEHIEESEPVREELPVENLVDSMSDEERMNVSIFLSNLSEAEFTFDSDIYGETENLINFAYIHASINSQSMIITDGEYEGLSAANVDNILDRFFGYTVPHKTPENSKRWIYRNGYFLVPAAAGASFADFSIVTGMTKRDGGNFDVTFNVYTDPTIGGGNFITDKNIYYLTDSEAAERFEYSHSGRAVLRVKKRNGKDAYEIVSYTLDNGTSSKN